MEIVEVGSNTEYGERLVPQAQQTVGNVHDFRRNKRHV